MHVVTLRRINPWHWQSNDHIWWFRKTSSHCFHDTNDPTTIYGDSGKLCHIVFVTLTIQRPYMATQENFVALFSWYWRSNDHIWWIWDTTGNFRVTQELVRYDIRFLSFILVKWRSNESLASVGLAQAHPNYYSNDDIHPSRVVSNQLPSGLILVILIIHGLTFWIHNYNYIATHITEYIHPCSGSVFSYDTHTYTKMLGLYHHYYTEDFHHIGFTGFN